MENIEAGGQPTEAAPQAQESPAPAAQAPGTGGDAAKPAEPRESLAEVIRRAREDRAARTRAEAEAAELRARQAAPSSEPDPTVDPIGWARARKLARETQAALGEALLYDIVPDKAPPDFRVKYLEAKIARDAEAKDRAAKEAQAKAEAEAGRRAMADYAATLHVAAKSFNAGSHPESEAWFGDDSGSYAKSLLATARNLAEVAKAEGRSPDLSPGAVADVLEKDIARRMTARDARRSPNANPVTPPPGNPGGAAEGKPLSTKGLTSGGPRPPAVSDKERVARALAAGWAKK